MEVQRFEDVACVGCGCVCDDLHITVRGGEIVHAENACTLAQPWLASIQGHRAAAEVDQQQATMAEATQRAAELLHAARCPIIYGLSRSSTDGQRAAVRLADRLGAAIDTTASLYHGPSIMAIQEVGESTCSLGEIRNRADLVIFWGSDPSVSHPRHAERYSVWPSGEFVPRGRQDRTVIVVDSQRTASCDMADIFVQVEAGMDFESIWTLRGLIRGQEPRPDCRLGADYAALKDLAERMKTCRCGVVFFGLGLTQTGVGHRNVEALLRLVTDLNAYTRFHAKRMRIPGDVTGADSVLCWQTGFPFSVNMNRGFPRYNPGEYSANEMLERHEPDACLLVGSEWVTHMTAKAQEYLRSIPTIVLDYPAIECPFPPTVRFTTAVYGLQVPGTAYRMDEIPIPLRAVLPANYPDDAFVLEQILNAIEAVA